MIETNSFVGDRTSWDGDEIFLAELIVARVKLAFDKGQKISIRVNHPIITTRFFNTLFLELAKEYTAEHVKDNLLLTMRKSLIQWAIVSFETANGIRMLK